MPSPTATLPPPPDSHHSHIDSHVRAGIITARHCYNESWIDITTRFRVNHSTALSIYKRAKARAGDSDDILELLKHCEDAPKPGRPRKRAKGRCFSVPCPSEAERLSNGSAAAAAAGVEKDDDEAARRHEGERANDSGLIFMRG